jgi:AcrR family transcriptional regulator
MSQWEPNARDRLEEAALHLFQKQGFDRTSVMEIAERAGLTERTFFRYFPDKREVLFGLQDNLLSTSVLAIEGAPGSTTPFKIIMAALEVLVPKFQERRAIILLRQSVIAGNIALQERDLLKQAIFIQGMADALKARGIRDTAATLAANAGGLVFKTAYARWVAEPDAPDLSRLIQAAFDQLKSILSG